MSAGCTGYAARDSRPQSFDAETEEIRVCRALAHCEALGEHQVGIVHPDQPDRIP